MARIVVVYKVYPEEAGADLDGLREKIAGKLPKEAEVAKWKTEPIAFGLSALVLWVIFPEELEGVLEEVEEAIRSVEGVGDIETVSVHRA